MTTKIKITKGKLKDKVGKVVGIYMNGNFDVKVGRAYITIRSNSFNYVD